jgi:FtsP/CotA-like multicopper oxidase with cupredoxin domain
MYIYEIDVLIISSDIFANRYEFETRAGGSFFWHSHVDLQRGDGVFGSLVVRKPRSSDRNGHLYDHDLPEHEILVWDWLSDLSLSVFLKHHHSDGTNKPPGILVNGKGLPPGFFSKVGENEVK